MLSATMRSAVTQALRSCAGGLPAKSLPSRAALVHRSFLVAPSYKSRVAERGFATATASKTTGRTAAKPATKAKPKPKAKATTTKAKKTAKAPAKKTAKAPAKKKAAPKPKKPVVRKKKELTPEQKDILLKRELKKTSLNGQEPKCLAGNRWTVYCGNALKGKASTPAETAVKMKALAAEYKTLSPAELEQLDETVVQNKAINAGNFKTWVESHPIGEIQKANVARLRLKRSFNIVPFPLRIVDERLPKRPAANSYAYFVKAKKPTGSYSKFTKELSEQWQALSATEKKPYEDLAAAENARFHKEMEKLHI